MPRAIKIENLKQIDATSVQILRVIALHLGESNEGYVDYTFIAASLNIKRDVVRSSVNRMVKSRILEKKNGKLSIPNSVMVK